MSQTHLLKCIHNFYLTFTKHSLTNVFILAWCYSCNIIYLMSFFPYFFQAVVIFYTLILLVLVGTNLHRFRPQTTRPRDVSSNRTRKKDRPVGQVDDAAVLSEHIVSEILPTIHYGRERSAHNDDVCSTSTSFKIEEERELSNPLLPTDNEIENYDTEMSNDECSDPIESIEVRYTSENKVTYTHSVIDSKLLDRQLSTNFDSISNSKNLHAPSFGNLQLSNTNSVDRGHEDSCDSKLSTTVVSNIDSESRASVLQKARVGFTTEEDVKPQGLLEMVGDDAIDPVQV